MFCRAVTLMGISRGMAASTKWRVCRSVCKDRKPSSRKLLLETQVVRSFARILKARAKLKTAAFPFVQRKVCLTRVILKDSILGGLRVGWNSGD